MKKVTNNLIPVLAIRNLLVFPGTAVPVRVGRHKSVLAIKRAYSEDGYILVTLQKNNEQEGEVSPQDLHTVGTYAKIEKMRGSDEDGYQVFLRGVSRYRMT